MYMKTPHKRHISVYLYRFGERMRENLEERERETPTERDTDRETNRGRENQNTSTVCDRSP